MASENPTTPPPGYPQIIPSPASLEPLHRVMGSCTRCDLSLSRNRVVPGSGPQDARILLVGEAPGATEDRDGIPFVGRSGALLDSMLAEGGIARDEVFIANVIRCRPPENRAPRPAELRACAGWLREQIRIIAPTLVVTLGRFALQHFVPAGRITQLQGTLLSMETPPGAISVYPLLHPSAILRDPRKRTAYAEQFRAIPGILEGLDRSALDR